MKVISSADLKGFNTFNLPSKAVKMVIIEHENEILSCFEKNMFRDNFLLLSGGSNVLLCSNFTGTVFHPVFKGVKIEEINEDNVIVSVKSGVVWDDFVAWCVVNEFGGLENLSLIPGYCGTAPVQNIGAYGTDISKNLLYIEGFNLVSGKFEKIKKNECELEYRSSIFKKELKDKFFITSTTYLLSVKNHRYILEYGNLKNAVDNINIDLSSIRKAVIDIRRSKLPDPQLTGNAGSFFKNPTVPVKLAKKIKEEYPELPVYPVDKSFSKIAAGWLIESCGWKGFRHGDASVHSKQALVIVNHGNSNQKEILELAEMIQESVMEKFGIELEREVNVIF